MEIIPKVGLDTLKFGLTPKEVKAIHGNPSHEFTDDFGDQILCYPDYGFAVKIEKENESKVGWIMVSNPSVSIFGIQPIGQNTVSVINQIQEHLSDSMEQTDYGTWSSNTFEDSWIEIQESLGFVTLINFGVPYGPNDKILWPK